MWIKALVASAIGVVAGFLLPLNGGDTQVLLKSLGELLLGVGTWLIIPLVFVQSINTSYEIYQEKGGLRFIWRGFVLIFLTALVLSLIGGFGTLLLSPERIGIGREEAQVPETPNFFKFIQTVFAPNILQALSGGIVYLVAAFAGGTIIGLGIRKQKTGVKPVLDFSDSLSRILHTINRWIVNILLYGSIILAAGRIVTIRHVTQINLFVQAIVVIVFLIIFVVFLLFPAVLYFVGKVKRPWDWLVHAVAPGLVGLFSGNNYLPLGILFQSGKEEFNLPRRTWQWFYPAAVIFCRAGTAMISSAAFILILRSHTSLEINFIQFMWVVFSSLFISFILGIVPGAGVMVSLYMLSSWYGKVLSEGFLILQPVLPILVCFSVLLDVVSQVFVSTLLSALPDKDVADEEERAERFREEFMSD